MDMINELIANGTYDFSTDEDLDNIESMQRFLDDAEAGDCVHDDAGTMVTLIVDEEWFRLDSYGLGDFYHHRIECTPITPDGDER